jgi:hypothetical protein
MKTKRNLRDSDPGTFFPINPSRNSKNSQKDGYTGTFFTTHRYQIPNLKIDFCSLIENPDPDENSLDPPNWL